MGQMKENTSPERGEKITHEKTSQDENKGRPGTVLERDEGLTTRGGGRNKSRLISTKQEKKDALKEGTQ